MLLMNGDRCVVLLVVALGSIEKKDKKTLLV